MRSPASCQTSHDVTAFGVTHPHGTHSRALASRFLVFLSLFFQIISCNQKNLKPTWRLSYLSSSGDPGAGVPTSCPSQDRPRIL